MQRHAAMKGHFRPHLHVAGQDGQQGQFQRRLAQHPRQVLRTGHQPVRRRARQVGGRQDDVALKPRGWPRQQGGGILDPHRLAPDQAQHPLPVQPRIHSGIRCRTHVRRDTGKAITVRNPAASAAEAAGDSNGGLQATDWISGIGAPCPPPGCSASNRARARLRLTGSLIRGWHSQVRRPGKDFNQTGERPGIAHHQLRDPAVGAHLPGRADDQVDRNPPPPAWPEPTPAPQDPCRPRSRQCSAAGVAAGAAGFPARTPACQQWIRPAAVPESCVASLGGDLGLRHQTLPPQLVPARQTALSAAQSAR